MDHAMRLVGSGSLPSVTDLATLAGVSRATAYRYFPSRSKLISAVVEESLGPVRRFSPSSNDGLARVRELFDSTFPRFREFEPQLRAALQLALEHQAMERAGLLEEEPFRRGHRRRILSEAAAPLRPLLGPRRFDQLLKTMSLVYGIESYIVLKDIWGCDDREIARLARWMIGALVDTALREAGAAGRSA
jgi:AcrR family transcriptional regulator